MIIYLFALYDIASNEDTWAKQWTGSERVFLNYCTDLF